MLAQNIVIWLNVDLYNWTPQSTSNQGVIPGVPGIPYPSLSIGYFLHFLIHNISFTLHATHFTKPKSPLCLVRRDASFVRSPLSCKQSKSAGIESTRQIDNEYDTYNKQGSTSRNCGAASNPESNRNDFLLDYILSSNY